MKQPTASLSYLGDLRTELTHLQSGTRILTDAPTDNMGRGEAFSPTDLVGAALLGCIITTIAIVARREGYEENLGNMDGDVLKVMSSEGPRRIAQLVVNIRFAGHSLDEKQQLIVQRIGNTCPVTRSLHPDLAVEITYTFA